MSIFRMSRRERVLSRFAPITEKSGIDRRMRIAVLRARHSKKLSKQFANQQAFDKAVAELVRTTPVSDEISEWFRNEKLIPDKKRSWRKIVLNPAVLAVALAFLVIAGVAAYNVSERMRDFPGSSTARKLLTVASTTRGGQLDPIAVPAGSLGDLFFMKYRLEHYDIAPEFAKLQTSGCRVFDDDEGHRVAQIAIPEKRIQLFLFPAAQNPKNARPQEFDGWRYVEQEGWSGAVQVKDGVAFMAALRGDKKDLASFVARQQREGSPTPAAVR
ncbi:MAG: hypothetical protein M3032_13595 [Verrucomicrobiota bacterium]|nr:hypothetical protein [Verrucomicrobiota bacterium]